MHAIAMSEPAVMDQRYARTIIGNHPDKFDAIEIQGVRDLNEVNDPDGTCCEVDNENPQFFSTYLHLKAGGVECVGDFGTFELASDYAQRLSARFNWPVRNFVPEKFH